MDDQKDDGNTTTTTTKSSKSKNLIDKLSHHRDHVDVDRDNPGRYCNINTDVTFTDGTTQEKIESQKSPSTFFSSVHLPSIIFHTGK